MVLLEPTSSPAHGLGQGLQTVSLSADEAPQIDHSIRRVIVRDDGQNAIFSLSLAGAPGVFRNFMAWTSHMVTYVFHSSTSLRRFVQLYKEQTGLSKSLLPPICIEIHVFQDPTFRDLSSWREHDMAHGYELNAHDHFKDWVEAIQTLHGAKVDIVMHRPWADYRSLRGVTAPLRRPGTGPREPSYNIGRVQVEQSSWNEFVEPDTHIHLTAAAIMGSPYSVWSDTTEEHATFLVTHGCRGFRL